MYGCIIEIMGNLEQAHRKRLNRTAMQEAILMTIASGGRLGASVLIPRVINSLLGIESETHGRKKETVSSTASRLRRKGFVCFEHGHYCLTEEGEKILKRWQSSEYMIPRPTKWDGKWLVVIFDIPEKKRVIRGELREILLSAGFQRLQDSVWVYPFECEDVIGLLKINLGIGKYLLYMIVDQIENDRFLRMDFGLI